MKKLCKMLLVLFVIYLIIQYSFYFFTKGHTIEYEIKTDENTFHIKEVFTTKEKNEHDNYFFTIQKDNTSFSFQTYQDFNKKSGILKKIYYHKTAEYECIFPIFDNNQVLSDVLCKKDDTTYNYTFLKGKDQNMDQFVASIEEYSEKKSSSLETQITNQISYYKDNVISKHFLAIVGYKGLYLINKDKNNYVELFEKDVYNPELSIFLDNYYIIANYNTPYSFRKISLVDIKTGTIQNLHFTHNISFDSYIQGIVDKSVYLFDCDNKIQYKIDIKNKKVEEVGNETKNIKFYDNGKWTLITATTAATKKQTFSYSEKADFYEKVDKIGNEKSGYYYFYKKKDSGYEVFRSNVQDKENKTYLFEIPNLDRVSYIEDYIYYYDGNSVNYYHDQKGIQKVFINKEYEFNDTIKFYVY